jgi:hypothetical protein
MALYRVKSIPISKRNSKKLITVDEIRNNKKLSLIEEIF